MTVAVRAVSGERLLTHADGVRAVYADAFGGPPWHEGPERADAYLERPAGDTHRPGFTAALALDGDTVVGRATARTTPHGTPAPRLPRAGGPDTAGPFRTRGSRRGPSPGPRHPARTAAPRPLEPLRPEQ
ncbi:hypothetical protein ABZ615_17900 [Streptomyces sp. NPDC007325]|uniref:hypothetical protein n=1 Tax=Streptomyces sp. NPDC007325 TaxID=3154588 RepID=UPI0033F61AFB